MIKIALQHLDKEAFDIYNSQVCREKYDIAYYKTPPLDAVPVGDLPFSTTHLTLPLVDNYPSCFSHILFRTIKIIESERPPLGYFIKPADFAKRFSGHIVTNPMDKRYTGSLYVSEPINFYPNSEVRYYITKGTIVFEEPNTCFSYKSFLQPLIPANMYGTVDIGMTHCGPTLVEYDYNIATGWYGDPANIDIYLEWLIAGFFHLQNLQ